MSINSTYRDAIKHNYWKQCNYTVLKKMDVCIFFVSIATHTGFSTEKIAVLTLCTSTLSCRCMSYAHYARGGLQAPPEHFTKFVALLHIVHSKGYILSITSIFKRTQISYSDALKKRQKDLFSRQLGPIPTLPRQPGPNETARPKARPMYLPSSSGVDSSVCRNRFVPFHKLKLHKNSSAARASDESSINFLVLLYHCITQH